MRDSADSKYSPLNESAFFMIQSRLNLIRKILAKSLHSPVEDLKFLEVGSGNGQWLCEFSSFGLLTSNMSGIELSKERCETAKKRVPSAEIVCGDASLLPWSDDHFDIVFQSTVFTSVKSHETRKKIASEMKRVCKKDGFILWYDFIYNSPSNPDVEGIGADQVRSLFEPWTCEFRKATLAPPIARRLVPVSRLASQILESFCPFLRTHILAEIRQ